MYKQMIPADVIAREVQFRRATDGVNYLAPRHEVSTAQMAELHRIPQSRSKSNWLSRGSVTFAWQRILRTSKDALRKNWIDAPLRRKTR